MSRPNLRASEWVLISFFSYVTVLSALLIPPALFIRAAATLVAITVILIAVALAARSLKALVPLRDFLPIGLTLIAFREMELFIAPKYGTKLEAALQHWDLVLFGSWHFRGIIESFGRIVPDYLELCYVLVYGLPFLCVGLLYAIGQRSEIDRFYLIYLPGTLLAYALFPFFPSRPPRLAFSGQWMPTIVTEFRRLNLFILSKATIHTAVFPSAHVSSAFAAGWAFLLLLWPRVRLGMALIAYAISVSVATVYGRYHYAADVVAGFGVSVLAATISLLMQRWRMSGSRP
jgi:membrane-associated phospholipid phosphatase